LWYDKGISIGFCFLVFFLFITPIVTSFSLCLNSEGNIITECNANFSISQHNSSLLQPGDIAFKHPEIFPDYFPTVIDHCLLFVEYNGTTGLYTFIEAGIPDNQVQLTYENESALFGAIYGPFARVKHATPIQKQNAIDFAKRQIGKRFQGEWINKNFNPDDLLNDSHANEWYCSELIWAAYYNCNHSFPEEEPESGYIYGEGIDLDRNGWHKNVFNSSIVAPREILRNRNQVSVFHLNSFQSKLQNIWEKFLDLFDNEFSIYYF